MFYRVYKAAPHGENVGENADRWAQERDQPLVIVSRKAWLPPTDVYETADAVVIKMEVAGLREGDLDISITGDVLRVRGLRRDEAAARKVGYHHLGIAYGEFMCDISLPGPVERDEISADYTAGFLTIALPKARRTQVRPVQVPVNPPR